MNLRKQLGLFLAGIIIALSAVSNQALAMSSAAPETSAIIPSLGQPELEAVYRVHCGRRAQIARRLNVLWSEERLLKAELEGSSQSGELVDFAEAERSLARVRGEIDALRGQLSQENKIILAIGDLIPD